MSVPSVGRMASEPVSRVEILISCNHLMDRDISSKSDPCCVLEMQNKNAYYYEVKNWHWIFAKLLFNYIVWVLWEYKLYKINLCKRMWDSSYILQSDYAYCYEAENDICCFFKTVLGCSAQNISLADGSLTVLACW